MRLVRLVVVVLLLGGAARAHAAPEVVVSIAPLHSLVANVMAGVGEPRLLLPAGASPHSYSLLPSDARALTRADLVVWVGPELEAFLAKPLATLGRDAERLAVAALPGMTLLETRSGTGWEGHDHGVGPDHHDDDHDHPGETHSHDLHLWLDPANAGVVVEAVASRLARRDPANSARYRANAERTLAALRALDAELRTALAPVRAAPFVVFHDAYHYLEARYGLNGVGAITLSPEFKPGARRVREIHGRISDSGARCVFREPQFEPDLVRAVVRGTQARVGVLDPLGGELQPGPEAYFQLMRTLAASLVDCLS